MIQKKLIQFCKRNKLKFINLNELEISDTNDKRLSQRKFGLKDNISYAIKGSEEVGLELVNYGKKIGFPVHYCSCQCKDSVQLANRLRLRAESISQTHELVDEEGMITRGTICKKKGNISENEFEEIKEYFDIPSKYIKFSTGKIEIHPIILEDIFKEIKTDFPNGNKFEATITKTYPTSDELILEKETL